jgi:hypothetical protein
MAITLNEWNEPNRFEGTHWMGYRLADGRALIALSGVAILNFQGQSQQAWRGDTFNIGLRLDKALGFLNLPAPPQGQANNLTLEQWIPYAALNSVSVFNQQAPSDAGYAVDRFYLPFGPGPYAEQDPLTIGVDVAARDSVATLFRVGYHLTVVGQTGTTPVVQ